MIKRYWTASIAFLLVGLFAGVQAWAGTITEAANGTYHLGTAERGAKQLMLQIGNMGGKPVLVTAACKRCPPAIYHLLKEQSHALDRGVFFNSMGLYAIQYDDESFILVQPDAELGRAEWKQIRYANIYSKNANTAKSVDQNKIKSFAIALSKKIMNQDVGEMKAGGGTYHLAMAKKHMGKAQRTYEIEFVDTPKKQIKVKPCDKCGTQVYALLPEETAAAGVDIYRYATSDYLFDVGDGVLLSTFQNAGGLGKKLWKSYDHYNVISSNLNYIRQVLNSQSKQKAIDDLMTVYFKSVKSAADKKAEEKRKKRVANQTLPAKGLSDNALTKEAFDSATRWAKSWGWKESLKEGYFTSSGWSITRHPISGIVTGRNISGVVTMTHPDGRCRFQYVSYRQQHDGKDFTNLHMTGVGPVYDIQCNKI